MILYQNYKNLFFLYIKSLWRELSISASSEQGRPKDRAWTTLLVWEIPRRSSREHMRRGDVWPLGAWKSRVLGGGLSSSSRNSLVLFSVLWSLGNQPWEHLWLPGLAEGNSSDWWCAPARIRTHPAAEGDCPCRRRRMVSHGGPVPASQRQWRRRHSCQ